MAQALEVVLAVEGVQFTYGAAPVLAGVTFHVTRGSFVGIVGPNGAGKSTLLRTIAATLRPDSGVIYLEGYAVQQMPRREIARRLAVVPQESQFGFRFTALEVVLMGRYAHLGRWSGERPADFEAARRAMELTGTWPLREREITELSGGERQRVIIARALTQEPRVLLLDEPTAHLDIGHQVEILGVLKQLSQREKLTVVAAMHDLNLAAQYSDRLILLQDGKIMALGEPTAVLTPENVRRAYGAEVLTYPHPLLRVPQVTIMPRGQEEAAQGRGLRVHLVAGGGAGASFMEELVARGYQLTIGVLNQGDTDWQVARILGLPMADEVPFADIGEQAYARNRELVSQAQAVVLLDIPFGRGNLRNLAVLEEALDRGIPTYMLGEPDLAGRDYTGGQAGELARRLEAKGLRFLPDREAVLAVLARLALEAAH
ncbi:MAG: heme ABC transporter ATP-binding protein [Clostridia bacterium]|nr:heme ABC transporter ATP-binding protein [Clostridia bacterium]